MVTTNDSRVRFVNIFDGSVLIKLKGHTNQKYHVRASLSPDLNNVICGSENGEVFLWSQIESQIENYTTSNNVNPLTGGKLPQKKKGADCVAYESFPAF